YIRGNVRVILGALDVLVCNSIQHGGNKIKISVKAFSSRLMISVQDNGRGLKIMDITDMDSHSLASRQGRLGLNPAKKALKATEGDLVVHRRRRPTKLAIIVHTYHKQKTQTDEKYSIN